MSKTGERVATHGLGRSEACSLLRCGGRKGGAMMPRLEGSTTKVARKEEAA